MGGLGLVNGGTCNGNLPINVPVTKTFAASAYHIKSTEPVTVYQFNPYETTRSAAAYSYTNDASLLIPVNAMTGNYQVAAWPSWHTLGFNSGGRHLLDLVELVRRARERRRRRARPTARP